MFSLKVTGVDVEPSAVFEVTRCSLVSMLAAGALACCTLACSAADSAPPPSSANPAAVGTVPGGQPGAPVPGVATGPGVSDPTQPPGAVPDPSAPLAPGVDVPGAVTPSTPATTIQGPDGTFVTEGNEPVIVSEPQDEVPPEDSLVGGKVCSSQEVAFEKVIPSVMLVLDRSTSMFRSNLANGSSPSPFGTYGDRWEALQAAVGGLEQYSSEVQFGAITFTGYSPSNGGTCPEVQGLDIDVATGTFGQIMDLLPDSEVAIPPSKSETPTAEGIELALDKLLSVETEGPKYLVLVTDGLPELCDPDLLDKGVWCGHDPAFGVVQNAYMNGVTTYVIGILGGSNDPNEDLAGDYFLNGMAHAGQGLPLQAPTENLHCIQQESRIARGEDPDNDFYENWRPWAAATYAEDGWEYEDKLYFAPTDGDALGVELGSVVASTRSCAFEMDTAIDRAQADKGAVQLEMADKSLVNLTYQDGNGWDLDPVNDYTVVIQGTSCEGIQTDQVKNVKIQFPCEVRVPRVR